FGSYYSCITIYFSASNVPPTFFPSYCTPRDLLSFPTRRSSDLRRYVAGRLGDDRAAPRGSLGRPRHDAHRGVSPVTDGREPRRRDRKSTRLNSSHDQNSYAVFCLKKKRSYSSV